MTSVPMLMPFPAVRAVHTSLGKTAASVKCTNCCFYVAKNDEILKCSGSKTKVIHKYRREQEKRCKIYINLNIEPCMHLLQRIAYVRKKKSL